MEQTDIANILSYVSIVSVLIPIVTFLFYPSESPLAFLLSILIMLALIADIANECYIRAGERGYLILNSYFLLQFILLGFIYFNIFNKQKLILWIVLGFILIWSLNLIFYQTINEYQSYSRILGSLILIVFAIISYKNNFNTPLENNNLNYLIHWINMGVLFYFFLNLYLFTISNYVLKHVFKDDAMVIWGFHSINNIVKNILFAIALFEAGRGIRVIRSNIQ